MTVSEGRLTLVGSSAGEGLPVRVAQAITRASQYLFNRPQSYAIAQAKENARGAGIEVAGKRDEIAYRTAALYVDAERSAAEAGRRARARGVAECE